VSSGLIAASGVLFVVWVLVERRVAEPMVDLGMLSRPKMAATNVVAALVGFSMFSTFISLPAFVEIPAGLPEAIADRVGYGFGASPIETGLFFIPSSLAMIVAGPFAGSLGTRLGPTIPLRIGLTTAGTGLLLFALFHSHPWHVFAWMAFLGIGIAFAFASIGKLAVDNARAEETGVATGINTIMRTIGAALGAQVAATVISANTLAGTAIPTEAAFTAAFAMGAVGTATALVPTIVLTRARPDPGTVGEAGLEPAR
jgi:MFS family permease